MVPVLVGLAFNHALFHDIVTLSIDLDGASGRLSDWLAIAGLANLVWHAGAGFSAMQTGLRFVFGR